LRHRLARKQGLQGLRFAPASPPERAPTRASARTRADATAPVQTCARTRFASVAEICLVNGW